MKKNYIEPEIISIELDEKISIMLQSVEDVNPESEPDWVTKNQDGFQGDPFKINVG